MPEGYEFGLFFHLAGVWALGGAMAISFATFSMMRRAKTVQEVRVWGSLGRLMSQYYVLPLTGLWLIVTGAYLVDEFSLEYSDGWVGFSLLAVAGAIANGLLVVTPRMKAIGGEAGPAPDGPVPSGIAEKLADPILFGAIHLNILLVTGILWNMTVKPGSFGALLALVVLGGIGAASAYPMYAKQQRGG
jgi:hypothetical protein